MGPVSEGGWRQRCAECGNLVLMSGVITGISGCPATATRATARRVCLTRRSACFGAHFEIQNSSESVGRLDGSGPRDAPCGTHHPTNERSPRVSRGYGGGRVWRGWNVAVGAAGATHAGLEYSDFFLKHVFLFFIFIKQ